MYVVVAGGGHMGTHLVARLVAEGHDTVAIEQYDADKGIEKFINFIKMINW